MSLHIRSHVSKDRDNKKESVTRKYAIQANYPIYNNGILNFMPSACLENLGKCYQSVTSSIIKDC